MKPQNLLIFGLVWPEPQSSAAGSRMMQLIRLFKALGCHITFASSARLNEYSEKLKSHEIVVEQVEPNDEKTSEFIKTVAPDIVLFDRFMIEEQFGWRVAELCPQALRILDTEDLHFLRKARHQALKQQRKLTSSDLYSQTAKREIASILRCDITLLISEVERDLLREEFKLNKAQLWYLPFLIDPIGEKEYSGFPEFEDRRNFIFVGNFLHSPNCDAVRYLKTAVWPLIHRRDPQLQMYVYGAYTTQRVKQLENRQENFYIEGRQNDLKKSLRQARVLLAPLRFGAGLKGKFVDAMRNGLPAVTTAIGAEGISGSSDFAGHIAETPEEIAGSAIDLYRDKKAWLRAQKNGYEMLIKRFDQKLFTVDFQDQLLSFSRNIEKHRRANFLGEVLMHHRQQSTKYLSRWIQAKNKLNKER